MKEYIKVNVLINELWQNEAPQNQRIGQDINHCQHPRRSPHASSHSTLASVAITSLFFFTCFAPKDAFLNVNTQLCLFVVSVQMDSYSVYSSESGFFFDMVNYIRIHLLLHVAVFAMTFLYTVHVSWCSFLKSI